MALETDRSPRAALDELRRHPHGDALARLVHALGVSAHDERRSSLDDGLDDAAHRLGIDEVSAETSFGNVLRALRKGEHANATEKTLLGALLAHGVSLAPPETPEAVAKLVGALAWLGAHTPVDATAALDDAAPAIAARGAELAAQAVARFDAGGAADPAGLDRASALVATLWLASTDTGRAALEPLRPTLRDPLLARLAAPAAPTETPARTLSGEQAPFPRGPLSTLALTLCLVLPAWALVRAVARVVLRLERPVELELRGSKLVVRSKLELLGRTLRERERVWDRATLARVAREVRFSSLPTYVGIAALFVGSYLGVRLALDGLRSGSPPYLAAGVGVVLLGLLVDWLGTRAPSRDPGRCRLVLETHGGERIAISGVDRRLADSALQDLARSPRA